MTYKEFSDQYDIVLFSYPAENKYINERHAGKELIVLLNIPLYFRVMDDGIDRAWYKIKAKDRKTGEIVEAAYGRYWRAWTSSTNRIATSFYVPFDKAPIVRPPHVYTIVLGAYSEFDKDYLQRYIEGKWSHGVHIHSNLWFPADIRATDPRQIKEFAELAQRKLIDRQVFKGADKSRAFHAEKVEESYDRDYLTTWHVYKNFTDLLDIYNKEMPEKNHAELLFYSLYVPLLKRCHETNCYTNMEEHVEGGKIHKIFDGNKWLEPLIWKKEK